MDIYEKRPHNHRPTSNRSKRRRYFTALTIVAICLVVYVHKNRSFENFDIQKAKYYSGYNSWSYSTSASSHSDEVAKAHSPAEEKVDAIQSLLPIDSAAWTSEASSSTDTAVSTAEAAIPDQLFDFENAHYQHAKEGAPELNQKTIKTSSSSTSASESAATAESTFSSDTITIDRQNSTEHPETSFSSSSSYSSSKHSSHHKKKDYTSTIVLGRMNSDAEKVKWVHDDLNNITTRMIYIVDDPNTDQPHLEKNHGREGMVYMKYIVSSINDDRLL